MGWDESVNAIARTLVVMGKLEVGQTGRLKRASLTSPIAFTPRAGEEQKPAWHSPVFEKLRCVMSSVSYTSSFPAFLHPESSLSPDIPLKPAVRPSGVFCTPTSLFIDPQLTFTQIVLLLPLYRRTQEYLVVQTQMRVEEPEGVQAAQRVGEDAPG